jgi:hypothetical protein
MRKIEVSLELGGDLLLACKLPPIVGGDGMHALRQWFQQARHGRFDCLGGGVLHCCQQRQLTLVLG